jgi:hypothetical protein
MNTFLKSVSPYWLVVFLLYDKENKFPKIIWQFPSTTKALLLNLKQKQK